MPDSLRSFKQHVRMLGPASEKVKSGLIDNLQAGVGTTRLDHLEYSGIYWQDFKEERRKAVYDGLQSGRWKDEDLMPFVGAARGAPTDLDYNRFAYWAKKQGHQDILTDLFIRESIKGLDAAERHGKDLGENIRDASYNG